MNRYTRPWWARAMSLAIWKQIQDLDQPGGPEEALDAEDPRETDTEFMTRIGREISDAERAEDAAALERLDEELLEFEAVTCGLCRGASDLSDTYVPRICRAHIAERRAVSELPE